MSDTVIDKQRIIERATLQAANHIISAMKAANAEKRITTVLGSPEGDYLMQLYLIDPNKPPESAEELKSRVKSSVRKMIQECTIFAMGNASTDGEKLKQKLEEYIETLEHGEK